MLANNEIGIVQPVAEIGKLCRERGRALPLRRGAGRGQGPLRRRRGEGRPRLDHRAQDLRPQGRRRAVRAPQAAGAHRPDHRRRRPRARHALGHAQRRGIVGFGKAAELARTEMADEAARLLAPARAAARRSSCPSWTCSIAQRLARAPAARATSTSPSPTSRARR